ncbi:MAG: HEAT repeat domain-containing protein [Candidatus Latescibacterota bacterium]|nr:HEAT repeat domain-containing protein [Candidatus Latescibacterota bacterium]
MTLLRRLIVLPSSVMLFAGCQEPSPDPEIERLSSMQSKIREKAAGKLLLFGERVVPRLIEETDSELIRVRFEVARILGRIKDPRATDALIELLNDSSFNVAQYAAWGLGEIQAPAAVPELLRHTQSVSKGFRGQVIRALGSCYDDNVHAELRDSIHTIVKGALRDSTPDVRISALLSARHLGYRVMTEEVIRMSRDPSAKVRHVAVQALGQLAVGDAPRSLGPVSVRTRTNIVEALMLSLEEPMQSIRTKAVRSLEKIGAQAAIPALERLLKTGTDKDQREARRVLEGLQATAAS